jgi:hypothetical protein
MSKEESFVGELAKTISEPDSSSVSLGYIIVGHSSSESHRMWIAEYEEKAISKIKELELDVEKRSVVTVDGSELNTLIIKSSTTPEVPDGIYVIRFNGNQEFAGAIASEMAEDSYNLGCHSICFDYQGVGESTGEPRSERSLVQAGRAQVQALLDKGVKPEQIILKGHSLGSAVATMLAAELHKDGKEVALFNSRSFSSLTSLVGGWAGKVSQPLARSILRSRGWAMDVVDSWLSIPPKSKELVFVKSDAIITDQGSLYRKLEKYKTTGTEEVKSRLKEEKKYLEIKPHEDYKHLATNHVLPLRMMKYDEGSGSDLFYDFVARVKREYQEKIIQLRKKEVAATVSKVRESVSDKRAVTFPVVPKSKELSLEK